MKKKVLAFTAFLAIMGGARAETAPADAATRFLVGMGVSGGGTSLATATYTDGGSHDIMTGGLIYFTAGADFRITPQVSIQATANYHFDSASAWNHDLKFERFPLELIGYYQPHPSWRVGGGIRYTSSPKLTGKGPAAGMDIKFDDSTGAVVEAEYFVNAKFGIKLRYVNETLKAQGGKNFDASHVGLSGNYYF